MSGSVPSHVAFSSPGAPSSDEKQDRMRHHGQWLLLTAISHTYIAAHYTANIKTAARIAQTRNIITLVLHDIQISSQQLGLGFNLHNV